MLNNHQNLIFETIQENSVFSPWMILLLIQGFRGQSLNQIRKDELKNETHGFHICVHQPNSLEKLFCRLVRLHQL